MESAEHHIRLPDEFESFEALIIKRKAELKNRSPNRLVESLQRLCTIHTTLSTENKKLKNGC